MYAVISLPFDKIVSGKSLLRYNKQKDYAIVQECAFKERPKQYFISDNDWKMEFSLSKKEIKPGRLETINDEPVSPDTARIFKSLKEKLLIKAKQNIGHFSIDN